ncbi:restriction endonuclease [Vibrio cholerae]|uniref:restriction endonuclease n=1 Tax=Vibrio cholerae TaxID=666 RepID=UPI001157AFE1|nr:restriction endonuclease [Vibrio cholerae]EGQ8494477.1 restriction endonuclease [Vibrio cholerae]EKF9089390.1 hypothetical protein [Vibrio cholerae]EMA7656781.1 hypothetical protein [Vibrio cholerae]TQP75836.1 restriction endonuclease [Vibrio cholerae]
MILTLNNLCHEARVFSSLESVHNEPTLFGVTDGKAVGTYLEQKFRNYLLEKYLFEIGNSAKGIDFPSLNVDMKVTSARQPQSSCPFRSARQKVYGLGYGLIVFVYDKIDFPENRTSRLNISNSIYIEPHKTADFQLTSSILHVLDNNGSEEDLIALFMDKNLPVDDILATELAREILINRPKIGCLTISNALQWRLQYTRAIEWAGNYEGVHSIYRAPSL